MIVLLASWLVNHMLYSKKHLQELMTQFWDNHFNTDMQKKIFPWFTEKAASLELLDGSLAVAPEAL